jgi:YHS domain-containing protein
LGKLNPASSLPQNTGAILKQRRESNVKKPINNPRREPRPSATIAGFGFAPPVFSGRVAESRRQLKVKRSIRITALLAMAVLLLGTMLALSQKKGQVQDPVCNLWVDKVAELSAEYKGETYYFCSKRDKDLFKANPSKYIKK